MSIAQSITQDRTVHANGMDEEDAHTGRDGRTRGDEKERMMDKEPFKR